MQEIPTFFDEEKELLEIDNDLSKKENLERDENLNKEENISNNDESNEDLEDEKEIQKEYEKIVKECEEQEKDFSFGSANHQEFIEEQNIKDIESTDFYKSDMWDKVERFSAYEKEANEELEENKKRQEKIEEELNNRKENKQENEQENQNNSKKQQFTKEDVKHKSTEDLEKELKNLKFRERELKNDLSEKREEDSKDFVKILEAKDINQLIQCLARIYYRSKQKRAIKNRLKDNKEHQNLNKTEIETLLKLEKIAKDLSLLSKHKENRYLLHDLAKNMANDRKESSKELQEIENNKKLSNEFENLMKDYERNKGNPKRQDNILNSFEKIYTNQFQGDKNISKSFEKTHYEQFKKINEFFTKNVKNRDFAKTKEKEASKSRAI